MSDEVARLALPGGVVLLPAADVRRLALVVASWCRVSQRRDGGTPAAVAELGRFLADAAEDAALHAHGGHEDVPGCGVVLDPESVTGSAEAGWMLGLSRRQVSRLAASGRFATGRLSGGRWRIGRAELAELAEERRRRSHG